MDGAMVLAALSWDPAIRGILVVAVSVAILCGSVYLLLATNTGMRLGLLIALTGLFGWMTLMGVVWTIYAQGLADQGPDPKWEVVEVNTDDLADAATEEARDLGSWRELPPADPLRGEAQAAADAVLAGTDEEPFERTSDYVPVGAFDKGGKPERDGNGIWDRVSNKVSNTLRFTHPTHYAVIQVQKVIPQEVVIGEAPPPPEPDTSEPEISVVLVRDLGAVRSKPAAFTGFCLVVFLILASSLHRRDKLAAATRAAAET